MAPQTVKSNIFIFTPHLLENPCPQKVWPRSSEEPAEQQEESSDQFLWAEEVWCSQQTVWYAALLQGPTLKIARLHPDPTPPRSPLLSCLHALPSTFTFPNYLIHLLSSQHQRDMDISGPQRLLSDLICHYHNKHEGATVTPPLP